MAPNPLPVSLRQECTKALKIFNSFVDPIKGVDNVIPSEVIRSAKGFAIFQVVKMGFLFSARAGSGLVIAKLPDGSWSAPSAIGTGGAGFGAQAGAEITDFLIILNSSSAVRSFMAAGSLQLGGNMSIAVGPTGRNTEAGGSVNTGGKVAMMYSYSKTRGLFGGVSLEGSIIVERSDANRIAYGYDVTAKQLLSGNVDPPEWAKGLIDCIEKRTGKPLGDGWINDEPEDVRNKWKEGYAFGAGIGAGGVNQDRPSKMTKRKSSISRPTLPRANSSGTNSFSQQFQRDFEDEELTAKPPASSENNRDKKRDSGHGFGSKGERDGFDDKVTADEVDDFFREQEDDFPARYSRQNSRSASRLSSVENPFESSFQTRARRSHSNPAMPPTQSPTYSPNLQPKKKKSFLSKTLSFRSGSKDKFGESDFVWRNDYDNPEKDETLDEVESPFSDKQQSSSSNRPKTPIVYNKGPTDEEKDLISWGPSKSYHSVSRHQEEEDKARGRFEREDRNAFDFDQFASELPSSNSRSISSTATTSFKQPTPFTASISPAFPPRPMSTGLKSLGRAIGLYNFDGVEAGDLSFKKGDVIEIIAKEDAEWWKGKIGSREGIFPKNYCEIVD